MNIKPQTGKVLAVIPARSKSKRIANKNIRNFLGKPLIAYAIGQALRLPFIDRVVVDTDSKKIATVAKRFGAEVPFLRPERLARGRSVLVDSLLHLLQRLKKEERYVPTYILILQATSPLRELDDIKKCWRLMRDSAATTVLTVCPTHPKLYHLRGKNDLILVNGSEAASNNTQEWEPGYVLNGCFAYIVKVAALQREKRVITKRTKAVVCDKWRSIDLDTPADWVLAELLYKNRKSIKERIKRI